MALFWTAEHVIEASIFLFRDVDRISQFLEVIKIHRDIKISMLATALVESDLETMFNDESVWALAWVIEENRAKIRKYLCLT